MKRINFGRKSIKAPAALQVTRCRGCGMTWKTYPTRVKCFSCGLFIVPGPLSS